MRSTKGKGKRETDDVNNVSEPNIITPYSLHVDAVYFHGVSLFKKIFLVGHSIDVTNLEFE
jgi:hypothetical protein